MSPILNEDAAARRAVRPMPRALPTHVELRTREVIASEADQRAAALREAYAPPTASAVVAPSIGTPVEGAAPKGRAPAATPTPRAKGPTAKERRAEAAAAAHAEEERYLRLRAGLSVAPTGAVGGVMHCGRLIPSYEGRFLMGADRGRAIAPPGPAVYPPIPKARPAPGYGPGVRP